MLRIPAEEELGGRYITMAGGGELCGWIGSTKKQRNWVDCGRKETAKGAEELRARRREGEGVGFKQLGWISDLAQPRRAFEFDPKSDGWASCREGQVEIEVGIFFLIHRRKKNVPDFGVYF